MESVLAENNLGKSTHDSDVIQPANIETDRDVGSSKGKKEEYESENEISEENPACVSRQFEDVMHHYEEFKKTNENDFKR